MARTAARPARAGFRRAPPSSSTGNSSAQSRSRCGVAPSVRTTRPHIQALLRCPGRERRVSRRSPTAGVRRATPLLQGARHRACGWVRQETVGGPERARRLSQRPRTSDAQTAAVHALPHALRRPSTARRHAHEESLVRPPRSSTRMSPGVPWFGPTSAPLRHVPAARQPTRWTRCIEHRHFRQSEQVRSRAAPPRGRPAATLRHDRRQSVRRQFRPEVEYPANPSVGSPASSGGRITPEATSSSKRLGPALGFRARRNEFGHDSTMRGNSNALPCLNPPYEAAQVVFEFTNACRCHRSNYTHMWPHQQAGCDSARRRPSD